MIGERLLLRIVFFRVINLRPIICNFCYLLLLTVAIVYLVYNRENYSCTRRILKLGRKSYSTTKIAIGGNYNTIYTNLDYYQYNIWIEGLTN